MSLRNRAEVALAFCSLLWGATFVVVKNALDHASVFIFLAVRFSLAALLMLALSHRALRQFEREDLLAGLRLGCFMFLGYAFQTAGLQYTTPAKSGFVTGSSVVLVPLLLALFWGRRLTWGAYAGAFVAVCGSGAVCSPHHSCGRVYAATFRQGAEPDSGSGLRGDGLGCGGRGGDSLAGCVLRMAVRIDTWNGHLRRTRHGRGLFHSTLGAAVHHARPRCHPVYPRAGLCGYYFVSDGSSF